MPEQRWPQQQAGQDLANHPRLAQLGKQVSEEVSSGNDDKQDESKRADFL